MILYGLRCRAMFSAVPKRITDVYFRVFDAEKEAEAHIESYKDWLIQNIEPVAFSTLDIDSIIIEIIPFEYTYTRL